MAKKSGKNNKKIIIGIFAAVLVVAVVAVAIVMSIKGSSGLSDAYFVSDDTKYVLTLDADQMSLSEEEYAPIKTHLVYTYSGDEVTGLKGYYEYENAQAAESAYNYFKDNQDGDYKSVTIEGKYVVLEANESEYEGLTASDVKQQIEYLEMLKSMDLNDSETVNEDSVEETNIVEE